MKVPKHFWNLVVLMFGLSLSLIAAWQLDIVASSIISANYEAVKTWQFFMPIVPPFTWAATYWFYPDAYVRFFILMWVGFVIALVSALSWGRKATP